MALLSRFPVIEAQAIQDLADDHPEEVARLADELRRWRTWAESQRLAADDASEMSAEELERLRSLGYL